MATAIISALENIPVKQDIAMTGSLSVRGDVLPVGGVTHKIEAAAKAGISSVIIPKANEQDVLLSSEYADMIEMVSATNIFEVLEAHQQVCAVPVDGQEPDEDYNKNLKRKLAQRFI